MKRDEMDFINRFLVGFRGFRERYFLQGASLFETLVNTGQRPKTLVVACSDSRVDPAILFGVEPGEIFVIRNVANLIPPYEPDGRHHGTSAALEFAVRDLQVRDILVLGHSSCGGIGALRDYLSGNHPQKREFIVPWVSIVADQETTMPVTEPSHLLEQVGIRKSIVNLRSFPWVSQRETEGNLTLHGWWFDMGVGQLWCLNESTGAFQPLELERHCDDAANCVTTGCS
ncbi:MAG: carbonic anhydrase [Magnetococcales bacterium]|nr:carbonic anhydrase [Magnetococcales bacterium]